MARKLTLAGLCDVVQMVRPFGCELRPASQFVASFLGNGNSRRKCRASVVSGSEPNPLLVAKPSLRGGTVPRPNASERDPQLAIESNFLPVEVRLGEAQSVGSGVIGARVFAFRSGLREQQKGEKHHQPATSQTSLMSAMGRKLPLAGEQHPFTPPTWRRRGRCWSRRGSPARTWRPRRRIPGPCRSPLRARCRPGRRSPPPRRRSRTRRP